MTTVAVLGAAGTIAPAILRDLDASVEVERIVALDLDGERASAVVAAHGGPRASAAAVAGTDDLDAHLHGVDVLVNAAPYRVNLAVMDACLRARCHYIDLGGLYHVTRRQFERHSAFADAGLLALLGMGSSPGKTNVMAALAVRDLEQVESIEIAAAGRDPDPRGEFSPPYALQTLLDEVTLAPVVLVDGAPTEIEPLADGGIVDFGEPIGSAATIYTLHSELATFASSFGCKSASFRLSLPPTLESRLRELRGRGTEAVMAASADAVPASTGTVSIHLIVARGGGRVVRVRARTDPYAPFGFGGSIMSTAAPAAAAVRLLARGAISARGVCAPESAVEPALLFAELATRGCAVTFETEEAP